MINGLIDFIDKLKKIPSISIKINHCRGTPKSWNPLKVGNKNRPGRWHIMGKFGALYLGENKEVCRNEIDRNLMGVRTAVEYKLTEMNLTLKKVLDLTNTKNLKILGVTKKQITSGSSKIIKEVKIPNSIAMSAYKMGYEAILAPSSTGKGTTLNIYEENLKRSSTIRIIGEEDLSFN